MVYLEKNMVPFAKNAGLLFKEIKKTASNRRVKIGSVENGCQTKRRTVSTTFVHCSVSPCG